VIWTGYRNSNPRPPPEMAGNHRFKPSVFSGSRYKPVLFWTAVNNLLHRDAPIPVNAHLEKAAHPDRSRDTL
jgi:ribosomal-protein-alanine N-acetyltransferase